MGNTSSKKQDFSIAQYNVFRIEYETFVKRPSLTIIAANNSIDAFNLLEKHALAALGKSNETLESIAYKPWCIEELPFKTDKEGVIYSNLVK